MFKGDVKKVLIQVAVVSGLGFNPLATSSVVHGSDAVTLRGLLMELQGAVMSRQPVLSCLLPLSQRCWHLLCAGGR